MSKLRVFCRRPAQNFPYGLTFLVEDPQPEEEIASATGVFVQYGNDPMQEALLKTYQDYRGTGVGTTLAHARNIKIEIIGRHHLQEGDTFEAELTVTEDHRHIFKIR